MLTPGEISNYSVSPQQLYQECRQPNSLNLFAALLMGDIFEEEFPETHVAYWALLVNAAFSGERELRYALGLPRGFAKTTLIKLFICWLYIYTDHRFVVIVSSTIALAKNVLKDIVDFMSTPNFRAIWGNWDNKVETETKEDVRFTFREKFCILQAIGAESSVRGLNVDNERPSVIICEDSQTRESAQSEIQNKAFITWFTGTLLKARSYRRSFVIYIGNMYNEQCLLNQLRLNDEWVSLVTSAILASGESIWPKFRTVKSLLREYRSDCSLGLGHVFLSEVMNDPTAMNGGFFDLAAIQPYQFDEDNTKNFIYAHYIIIDPATGKQGGDDTAIGAVAVINGKAVLVEVLHDKWGDDETVREGLKLALKYRACLIAVESVAYQITLCNYFKRTINQKRIQGIQIVEVSPHGVAKQKRIFSGTQKWLKQEIDIHPNARPAVMDQATFYNPTIPKSIDDILDVVAYMDPVLQENWPLLYLTDNMDEDSAGPGVPDVSITSCF